MSWAEAWGRFLGWRHPGETCCHSRVVEGVGCGCSGRQTSGRRNKVHGDEHRGGDGPSAPRPGLSWDKAQHESNSRLQPEGAGQMENCRFTLRNAPQLGMRRSSTGCGEQLQTQEKVHLQRHKPARSLTGQERPGEQENSRRRSWANLFLWGESFDGVDV